MNAANNGAYVADFGALGRALAASRRKILVFMSFVMLVVLIMGTLMYVVEDPAHGYTSIPVGLYWAITTMTTVGFGDLTPKTDPGRPEGATTPHHAHLSRVSDRGPRDAPHANSGR